MISLINHPGREIHLANIRKSDVPATPPSKGGETIVTLSTINYNPEPDGNTTRA